MDGNDDQTLVKGFFQRYPNVRTAAIEALLRAKTRHLEGSLPFPRQDVLRNPYAVDNFLAAVPIKTNTYYNPSPELQRQDINVSLTLSQPVEDYLSLRKRQNSQWAMKLVTEGVQKMMAKDNEAAIKKFSTAIEIDPMCAEGYVGRGAAFANQRRFDDAISEFKYCLTISPEHSNAITYLEKCTKKKAEIDEEKRLAAIEEARKKGKKMKDDGVQLSRSPELYGPLPPSKSSSQSSLSTHHSSRTDSLHRSKKKRKRKHGDNNDSGSDSSRGHHSNSKNGHSKRKLKDKGRHYVESSPDHNTSMKARDKDTRSSRSSSRRASRTSAGASESSGDSTDSFSDKKRKSLTKHDEHHKSKKRKT
ncbi:hypothetical protein HDU67_004563 [Dinochytrium kinnereticum]|nr:hypothetical protein HDU67_004563 [Dinochytrium kinnereticum]